TVLAVRATGARTASVVAIPISGLSYGNLRGLAKIARTRSDGQLPRADGQLPRAALVDVSRAHSAAAARSGGSGLVTWSSRPVRGWRNRSSAACRNWRGTRAAKARAQALPGPLIPRSAPPPYTGSPTTG